MKRSIASVVTLLLVFMAIGLVVKTAVDTSAFAHELAQERTQAILRTCQEQNSRHTGTVNQLDAELAQVSRGASPAKREQLRASRALTVLLIDQLAPYQNCQLVLSRSTTK